MSVSALNSQEIKALEQTRQRLSQLSHSLSSLHQQIAHSDPLPPWSGLQAAAAIISQHLASVSQQLSTHQELFASMMVYPLAEFPGQSQETLLGQLLRKKLEPNVEDWVAEGRKIGMGAADQRNPNTMKASETHDLWEWAGMSANEDARKHTWGGNYTLEEREMGVQNVVTGLRRKLKDDSDNESNSDDEDAMEEAPDGDEMEVVGVRRKDSGDGVEFDIRRGSEHKPTGIHLPALPINDVFRFMMTGKIPPRE